MLIIQSPIKKNIGIESLGQYYSRKVLKEFFIPIEHLNYNDDRSLAQGCFVSLEAAEDDEESDSPGGESTTAKF